MENTHLLLSFYLVSHFMVKTRYCIFKNLVQSNINFVNTTLTVIKIIFIISWCSQCMMKISFISITSTVFLKKPFLLAGNVDELPSCQVRLSEKKKGKCEVCFVNDYLFNVICMLTCIQHKFVLNHVAKISLAISQTRCYTGQWSDLQPTHWLSSIWANK